MDVYPKCSNEFLLPSRLQSVFYLGYALILAFLPSFLVKEIWDLAVPSWLAIVYCMPLWLVGGYGFFMLAGTAHEGFHFNLHPNPVKSSILGIFFSSAVPGFLAVGFYISHWMHHRFTNTPDDPDFVLFSRFKSVWSRAFRARLAANSTYRRIALDTANGKYSEGARQGTIKHEALRKLAKCNFAAQAIWIGIYIFFATIAWKIAILGVMGSMVMAIIITGLNPYQEHGVTGKEVINRARTRTSAVFTILMCGTNYHFEHHLYPRVPCWRLPRLHQWLKGTAWYQAQEIIVEQSYIRSFIPAIMGNAHYGELYQNSDDTTKKKSTRPVRSV